MDSHRICGVHHVRLDVAACVMAGTECVRVAAAAARGPHVSVDEDVYASSSKASNDADAERMLLIPRCMYLQEVRVPCDGELMRGDG
jgi:hypothetical protein